MTTMGFPIFSIRRRVTTATGKTSEWERVLVSGERDACNDVAQMASGLPGQSRGVERPQPDEHLLEA